MVNEIKIMDKEQQARIITKALAYAENGGKPTIIRAGKSGEMKSIFQFTPETWKLYSKQILGEEVPLSSEMEAYVVNEKVKKWLDQGYNVQQIASMWNAGEKRPDAYKQNWKGINKYGVKYDTPAYAQKVFNYSKEFQKEPPSSVATPEVKTKETKSDLKFPAQTIPKVALPATQNVGSIGSLIKLAQSAGQTPPVGQPPLPKPPTFN